MAAVTYGAHSALETAKPLEKTAKGKSALMRFFEAIGEARLRQAQREIEMHRHLLPEDFEIAGHKINARNEDTLPFLR